MNTDVILFEELVILSVGKVSSFIGAYWAFYNPV
jgi:hypothetical protein